MALGKVHTSAKAGDPAKLIIKQTSDKTYSLLRGMSDRHLTVTLTLYKPQP